MSKINVKNFYSYNKVLSYNGVYNFVVGGRGIGKTFGAKKLAIDKAIKRGEEFILVRRFKEEVVAAKTTFFEDVRHVFPKHEFRVQGKFAQYAQALPDNFDELEAKDQKALMKDREWKTIGYFIALSTAQREKGTSYPRVKRILFDEFIIEKGLTHYLPDETTVFNNFYSTVDRYKDQVIVLFLANSVMIDNPYFIHYDIDPDQARNGIIVKNNGFLVVDFPDSADFQNDVFKTRFGQFIETTSPEYAAYAVGNEFRDNHKQLIDDKESRADYLFSIETDKGTFSLWSVFSSGVVYCQKKLPKSQRMFTTVPNNMSEEKIFLPQNDSVLSKLRTTWRTGSMRFDSPQTRNAMLDIFK